MWTWETKVKPKGVMVIVHGSGEHHGRYEWLREQWLTRGYHVVQGDLPGQGINPRKRGHIDHFDEYIESITLWLNHARHFSLPVFILGHSLGGLAVIRALQEKKEEVSGVVLSSPCLGLVSKPPQLVVLLARIIDQIKPDFLVPIKKSPVNHNATRNMDILKRDEQDPLIVKKVSTRWFLELDKAIDLAFEKKSHFPDAPLLILQGGHDKIVDKYSVKRWYDQLSLSMGQYVELSGLYHEVFNEPERDKVFQQAYDFIEQQL